MTEAQFAAKYRVYEAIRRLVTDRGVSLQRLEESNELDYAAPTKTMKEGFTVRLMVHEPSQALGTDPGISLEFHSLTEKNLGFVVAVFKESDKWSIITSSDHVDYEYTGPKPDVEVQDGANDEKAFAAAWKMLEFYLKA